MFHPTSPILFVALFLLGCTGKTGPGGLCEEDSECRDDLSCMNAQWIGGDVTQVCTRTCEVDEDCPDLCERGGRMPCRDGVCGLYLCR